jgi:transketolase
MYLIYGDVGGVMFAGIRKEFPGRVLNFGVAEQARVSFAAGMAIAGWRPVVYTITPFLIERAFEQIKLDVAQMRLPVGLVGHSDGHGGPTHNEIDALRLMALLPEIASHYPTKEQIGPIVAGIDLDKRWFISLHE